MNELGGPRVSLLEATGNPHQLAVIRVAIGVIAVVKGLSLTFVSGGSLGITIPWIALSLAVVLGWGARFAASLLVIFGAYLMLAGMYWNHLYLLTLVLLLLALSDCERHYALLSRGRGDAPVWPLFLMRCQLSIVYFFAGVAKLNAEFLSGDMLRYQFENAIWPMPDPGALAPVLSYATIGLELFLAAAVWSTRLRSTALGIVLPLHIGMLTIARDANDFFGIVVFSLLMFALLLAFLRVPERGRTVVWDDQCSFCGRWVSVLRKADAFAALRFVGLSRTEAYEPLGVRREEADRAIQLVEPDGTVRGGYDAVRGMVAVVPGGHLVAPLMALPGIPAIGERVYARVAARRSCRYEPGTEADASRRP